MDKLWNQLKDKIRSVAVDYDKRLNRMGQTMQIEGVSREDCVVD